MRVQAWSTLAIIGVFLLFAPISVYADNSVTIISQSSFVDSGGRTNVVGTIRNTGTMPVQVTVGLDVTDDSGRRVVQEPTYGRIVWPLTDSPFKFTVDPDTHVAGEPFIMNVREIEAPHYSTLVLNYSSMAAGEDKVFAGTLRNTGPFDIYNVSVFASARDDHAGQLDTVRSNVIQVIRPGEEKAFIATPDDAARGGVLYYSCAGLDFDEPITTMEVEGGQFVAYDLRTLSKISSFRYESGTDSIAFGVMPYGPNGGPLSLKIPHLSENQTVTVMMDGEAYEEASIRGDGKTMYIDFFVPKGDHEVQIQGVRSVPELPLAAIALAAATAVVIVAARSRAAFRI